MESNSEFLSPEIRKSFGDVREGVVIRDVPVEDVVLAHLHEVDVVPDH